MVLKTHLEPFREPLKVPPVGQPKNPFFYIVTQRITKVYCSFQIILEIKQ